MNQISVYFDECVPAPSMGYRVWWRVAGSGDPLQNAGSFFTSPAVFYDATNPPGTEYEGIIASFTRSGLCNPVDWTTVEPSISSVPSGSIPPTEFLFYLSDEYECPDCMFPVRTDVLVRLPANHTVQIGKYYKAQPNLGFAYVISSDEPQPDNPHIVLTTSNYTTCGVICGGG